MNGSQVALPPANAEVTRDVGSMPGLGISPVVGNGTLLQCSCLENFMSRGVWQSAVHGATKSRAWLSD